MPSISSGDDHECSETFITKAEALFYGENYDAENQASITVAQIRGADLYQRMYTIMPTTLPQLKSQLVEHYGGVMALIRLQRRMLTETPSAKQTPAEFAAAKYRLWYRIYKTEEPHWVRVTIELSQRDLRPFLRFQNIARIRRAAEPLTCPGALHRKPGDQQEEPDVWHGATLDQVALRGLPMFSYK